MLELALQVPISHGRTAAALLMLKFIKVKGNAACSTFIFICQSKYMEKYIHCLLFWVVQISYLLK